MENVDANIPKTSTKTGSVEVFGILASTFSIP